MDPLRFAPVLDTDPKEAFHYSIDRLRAIQRVRAKAEMHRDTALRHRHDVHRLVRARVLLLMRRDPRFCFPGVSENVCFTLPGPVRESQGGIGREPAGGGGGGAGAGAGGAPLVLPRPWWCGGESYSSLVAREE